MEAEQLILYLFQALILLLLILLMRMLRNGGTKDLGNGGPGKATICIERGEKIQKYDTELLHLIKDLDEEKGERDKFRTEMLGNFGTVFTELRKINGMSK